MSEKLKDLNNYKDLMINLPLFSCIIREHLWLKKFTLSKSFLKKSIEDPKNFKDFSILKSIRTDDSTLSNLESLNIINNKKSQEKLEPQLKLYKDFQWSIIPEYYWPIYSGDYSPLSPDGEFLERYGKIGVDFWNWNRETSPLGYIPPLCTCKRTEDCVKNLRKWSKNPKIDYDYTVCQNDVCKGLLYIPYSLLEIPLNRVISNGSEFALKVKVPDYTDLYCGNMKHTIILCTISKKHEEECLKAIEVSDVSPPLIYDVNPKDFVPFFKKYNETTRESPLMSLEPIDSDVSDTENYGLGQLFAIKKLNQNLLIEKYDPNTKTITAIDDPLMETWEKMCNIDRTDSDITEVKEENNKKDNENKANNNKENGKEPSKQDNNNTNNTNNNQTNNGKNNNNNFKKNNELKRQNSDDTKVKMTKGNKKGSKNNLKKEMKMKTEKEEKKENTTYDNKNNDEKQNIEKENVNELEKVKKELEKQEYQIYELIESFSSDRRPLSFTLRDEYSQEKVEKRSYKGYNDFKESNKLKKIKVDQKTLESTHLLNILSKF